MVERLEKYVEVVSTLHDKVERAFETEAKHCLSETSKLWEKFLFESFVKLGQCNACIANSWVQVEQIVHLTI